MMENKDMKELKEGWRIVKLGEVAEYINNKIDTSELNENNYISTENMRVDRGGITAASNIPKNVKVNYFEKNDILFSNIRTYFKKLWKSDFSGGASNDVLIIRSLNSQKILNDYLYYILSEKKFFDYTINTSKGTKMPRGDKSAILRYEFLIPEDIKIQEKIASILLALDNKIEINNEMNKTLEEMAQTLFKRWFIDFDFPNENGEPYRSSGGKMVDSELGEIPEGWRISSLEELLEVIIDHRGKTPKKLGGDWSEKGIKAISAKNIKNLELVNLENMNMVDIEMYNKWMKDKLIDGDILMTSEAPLGELYYLAEKKEYVLSQRIYGLRADRTKMLPAVLFYSLQSPVVMSEILNRATGTTVTGIRQTELRKVNLIIPPCELQEKIENILHKNLLKKFKLFEEIQSLTEIRDTLLPKLMSGEVEV